MDGSEVITQRVSIATPDTGNTLNKWVFERAKKFVTGRVLEITTYEGNIAEIIRQQGFVAESQPINLSNDTFNANYADLMGVFNTVIVLHEADQMSDRVILHNCTKLLKRGGVLITSLPTKTALYKWLIEGFEDWYKYNQAYINELLRVDYKIIKVRYFLVDTIQSIYQLENESKEWVTVFSSNNAIGYEKTGLSAIIVAQKR